MGVDKISVVLLQSLTPFLRQREGVVRRVRKIRKDSKRVSGVEILENPFYSVEAKVDYRSDGAVNFALLPFPFLPLFLSVCLISFLPSPSFFLECLKYDEYTYVCMYVCM